MDLINKQFGELTVKQLCSERVKGKKQYICDCSCGKETIKTRNVLITGNSKSCGHTKFTFKQEDYIGKKYNQLTCLEYVRYGDGVTGHFFNFQCDCNEIIELPINNVKSGNTKHCGCKYKIQVGQKFGELEVIDVDNTIKNEFGHIKYLVQCSCGNIKSIERGHLLKAKTCGKDHVNIIGQNFGMLKVIQKCNYNINNQKYNFICKCECGKEIEVIKCNLISGRTLSCGCYNSALTIERHKEYRRSKGYDENIFLNDITNTLRNNTSALVKHLVIKADDYKCILCSGKENFHIHHIEPVDSFLNLQDKNTYHKLYDFNNLVTLCKDCHKVVHGKSWNEINEDMQITLIDYRKKNSINEDLKIEFSKIENNIIKFIDNFNYELMSIG